MHMVNKKASPLGYEAESVIITPAEASKWLSENKFDNRRLDDRNVDRIARDIKKGRWVFDGNPIRFDEDGNIIDGQHRLWAIVTAGKQVEYLIIRGLKTEAKMTIDSGKNRSIGDILHFAGHVNTNMLASVCRLAVGYKDTKGDMWKWARENSHKRLSSQEIIEEAANNKRTVEAAQTMVSMTMTKRIMGAALAAFSYYLFSSICSDKYVVDNFFQGVEKGVNLASDSPILLLRNTLTIRDTYLHAAEKQGGNKSHAYKLAIIIKAWNAYRSNKTLQRLKYDIGREAYPIPQR